MTELGDLMVHITQTKNHQDRTGDFLLFSDSHPYIWSGLEVKFSLLSDCKHRILCIS
jgi:hypothetical protein